MPTAYQRQIDAAFALIAKKGKNVTLKRSAVTIEPITQDITTVASEEVQVAVVLPVSSTRRGMNEAALKDLQGSKVRKLLIAAKGLVLTPEIKDTYNIGQLDGNDWKIYGIDTLAPDGEPILHSIIVSK